MQLFILQAKLGGGSLVFCYGDNGMLQS